MIKLKRRHNTLIENTSLDIKRYLYHELPWDERLIGIKGLRGVGKTTLMLQYIKEKYNSDNTEALYVTLDDLYFTENTLIDLADEFVAKGGKHLFLDEVHKYPNWSTELKNIYDYHPNLKTIFTASSLLEILNSRADLSRRALSYHMHGLSFREFLQHRHGIKLEAYTLEEILKKHEKICLKLSKNVKPLKYFDEYLQNGYFPYFGGNTILYYKRLTEVMNMSIDIELPLLRNIETANLSKIKKLLYIISQSVPFKPNITSLSQKTDISRNSVLEYLNALNDSYIINSIYKSAHGISFLQKPDKIFLENTNLIYALSHDYINIGNIRETFFLNQLNSKYTITYPENGDFLVNGKWLFEVGGKTKTGKQIKGEKDAYIAADQIEIGAEKQIPLWLFGFLY